ncbi:MAG: hypothetical protein ACREN2_06220 [Candidatus Dormibacteria bacterium]
MTDSARESRVAAIKAAIDVVDAADTPADLRSAAFAWVLAQRSSAEVAPGTGRFPSAAGAPTQPDPAPSRLTLIAARLELTEEELERIYDTSTDQLNLVFSRSKLSAQKARAAKDVALIFAAGDEAGYGRDWTPIAPIRESCRNYGVFDSGNFAGSVTGAGDALIVRGKGLQREVRLTRPGYEQVRDLIRNLLQ